MQKTIDLRLKIFIKFHWYLQGKLKQSTDGSRYRYCNPAMPEALFCLWFLWILDMLFAVENWTLCILPKKFKMFFFQLINDYKEREKIVFDAVFLGFVQFYCSLHHFKVLDANRVEVDRFRIGRVLTIPRSKAASILNF